MNYYRRYMGDYAKKTAALSLAEHGAYNLLLDECYSTECGLPGDHESLFRLCRAMTKVEQEAVRKVADRFFPVGQDGLRRNPRADEEINIAQPAIEAARENGAKGGRTKAENSDYMSGPGVLYAIRVSTETVKVGVSANFTSRLYQHKKKYGHSIVVIKTVSVSNMGAAELELLRAFDRIANCEEFAMRYEDEKDLLSEMDRIAVAYMPQGGSHTSRIHPPTTNHQPPTATPQEPTARKARSKAEVAPLALPAWLNAETWNRYIKIRPARARTPDALQAALEKLGKFREQGFDANEIVSTSLANGWQMLKPPDPNRGGIGRQAALEARNAEASRRFLEQPE